MKFTKMHGIGNDYVYVNCFKEEVKNPAAVARFASDRHFGIGSDGLILIRPSEKGDCTMDMYNLDGSQGAMCGNGIRCVAKYEIPSSDTERRKSIGSAGQYGRTDLECKRYPDPFRERKSDR